MSQRPLLHLLVIAVVVVAILYFPEFRNTQSMAESPRAERSELDDGLPAGDPLGDLLATELSSGIRGRVLGVSGEPVAELELAAVAPDVPGEEPELVALRPSTRSLPDGTFELSWADPDDALELRGPEFVALDERRREHADGSVSVLLIVAPTAPVAGRVAGAGGGRIVRFHGTQRLAAGVDGAEEESELHFERELETDANGHFDFGHVPCGGTAYLETLDEDGRPSRVELSAQGTLDAVLE